MRAPLLSLLLLPALLAAQTPAKQGLVEYLLPDGRDTIRFYVYNPDSIAKTKIFLYLQGSGALPLVNGDESEPCCYNNYPKKLMKAFPAEYAFVYIQKMGLPYYVRNITEFTPGSVFTRRNTVLDRAQVADKVLDYLLDRVYPQTLIVAVLGHSEGSDVAAKLAVMNQRVSHLCFASGNGMPQAINDVLLLRRQMHKGDMTPVEAQNRLEAYFAGLDSVYWDPAAINKSFRGDTYAWHSAINRPPLDNLLQLNIPVFLAIGSNDEKVPVEASDMIKAEFVRHRKTNLTYKVYMNCNHGFVETLPDGTMADHWTELFMDFLKFVERGGSSQ